MRALPSWMNAYYSRAPGCEFNFLLSLPFCLLPWDDTAWRLSPDALHSTFDSQLPELWEINFFCLWITQALVFCYGRTKQAKPMFLTFRPTVNYPQSLNKPHDLQFLSHSLRPSLTYLPLPPWWIISTICFKSWFIHHNSRKLPWVVCPLYEWHVLSSWWL
jgi:hypothetical protein